MGSVFGKINEETPEFDSLGRVEDLEIRRYKPIFTATISSRDVPEAKTREEFSGTAFRALAKYIGVFSKPQNRAADSDQSESIPMTAPVMMTTNETAGVAGEPISMTAPVLMKGEALDWTMSFILPSKYIKEGREPPAPLDPRIKISRVPERTMAVKTFSGFLSMTKGDMYAAKAVETIKKNVTTREVMINSAGEPEWELMGYNSPFVLPCYRTNEVGVLLREKTV